MTEFINDFIIVISTILWSCILFLWLFLLIKKIIWCFKTQLYDTHLNIKLSLWVLFINSFWFIIYMFLQAVSNINIVFLISLLYLFPAITATILYLFFLSKKYWRENSIYIFISLLLWNFCSLLILMVWVFRWWM